ncbi:peptide-methionine (S)-S-oxide reductase MsrA [Tautonia plasticadhaerens]|uniref:Peptide methionine sulfoxide reductase MsrA n=1 Tax=Tautonia plasticadhaerens TaxID=2527974 RepID=A0A518H4P0_9BACT|nr:peptide-methionine (S)-S-oxide reductase MsrA [Tautonia plasticadhaerens]QDV35801.1 Peptide methionine sulfoxide reductase MsrA [Tautonia plasticadhaerens]
MTIAISTALLLAIAGAPADPGPGVGPVVAAPSQPQKTPQQGDRPAEEPAVQTDEPKETETGGKPDTGQEGETAAPPVSSEPKLATFGGGCFWCTEAVFELVKGVGDVVSGYSGGRVPFPSYEQVSTGLTGHAEVIQVTYDPSVVSYAELLEIFWKTHDPTTLNRQGPDIGTQYRSIILAHDQAQFDEAKELKAKLNEAKVFRKPVVTQVVPIEAFFPAEPYHQDYFRKHPNAGYCQFQIIPKLKKFSQVFRDKMKGAPGNGG